MTAQLTLLLMLALLPGGCATIYSQADYWAHDRDTSATDRIVPDAWEHVHIYRGTMTDIGVWGMLTGAKRHEPEPGDGTWYLFVLDLPFSFVADTFLLPLTIAQQIRAAVLSGAHVES